MTTLKNQTIVNLLALILMIGFTSCQKDNSLTNELNTPQQTENLGGGDDEIAESSSAEQSEFIINTSLKNSISVNNSNAEYLVLNGVANGVTEEFGAINFLESRTIKSSTSVMVGEGYITIGDFGKAKFTSYASNAPLMVSSNEPSFTFTITVDGGTGRFQKASGTITVLVEDHPTEQMKEIITLTGVVETNQ